MDIVTELTVKQKNVTRLIISIFGVLNLIIFRKSLILSTIWAVILTLSLRNTEFIFALVNSCKRDVLAGWRYLKLNLHIMNIERKGWSVARIFQDLVRKNPKKNFLVMEERELTFQDVEEFSNKIGTYFKLKGFKHGDCIALLMETQIEYPCLWLGLSKIGVVTALINSHLRRDTLLHSIRVANCKGIIVSHELSKALEDIVTDPELKDLQIFQYGSEAETNETTTLLNGAVDLTKELRNQTSNDLSADIKLCKPSDKLLYIYTSGTTGLPKAAVITNLRYIFMTTAANMMLAFNSNDVIYNSLPLYHTAGGIVGIGNGLIHGCSVVIRKKFSVSNFWKDCIKYKCTIAQYIGELCRYLLSAPSKPEDTQHQLRMMYGNGLRPQIWSQFVTRFKIPFIGEIYGSTEGNSNLANITNKMGAVGFIPIPFRRLMPVHIIQVDEETGDPIRGKNGFCIRCKPGVTGLLIGVVDHRRAFTTFNGYVDEKASKQKLLKDVFRKGDLFFNSGDMIVSDLFGYIYFKDRTGDTFRWRGENVATLEVEAIITNVIGLKDCAVYGVDIPFVEGKAGMAAIVDPERKVDLENLSAGIRGSLPVYARPLFIRLLDEIPRTATFKMKKRNLMLEAFDINKIKDPIYYMNRDGSYRLLTIDQYNDLINGKAGL